MTMLTELTIAKVPRVRMDAGFGADSDSTDSFWLAVSLGWVYLNTRNCRETPARSLVNAAVPSDTRLETLRAQ